MPKNQSTAAKHARAATRQGAKYTEALRAEEAKSADNAVLARLIAELKTRTAEPAREHVTSVAAALREQGWMLYPPVPRTPNPKYARRYLRWERRWPHGTVISLYQEPAGFLSVHAKMATDDPRWFSKTYGINTDGEEVTAVDVAASLAAYADRITGHDAGRQANL